MNNYTIVVPDQPQLAAEIFLQALCVYREASNQPYEAKLGVAWVLKNRWMKPSWWGKTPIQVTTKDAQFTSMNPPKHMYDPNLERWPTDHDKAWAESLLAVFDARVDNAADPTDGAQFYFDKSLDKNPPAWSKLYKHTVDLGAFHFYRA